MANLDDVLNAHLMGLPSPAPEALHKVGTMRLALLEDKMDELRKIDERKTADLDNALAAMTGAASQIQKAREATQNSWVGRLGLDPDGVIGTAVNAVAGVATGASRDLAGKTLALPFSFDAFAKDNSLDQGDVEAMNRYKTGQATPADMQRLSKPRDMATPLGGEEGSLAATPQTTLLELAKQADASRQTARTINDKFDISSIEHNETKNRLTNDLDNGFTEGMTKIHQGHTASGIASLLVNAGDAAISNPRGVAQFVFENAPQLLVGALGAAGKAEMTASNIGYAADYYQQGMENYAQKNGGKLPDATERQKIAAMAASLAVAEQLGDHVGLAATGLANKAAKLAGRETEDAAKTGLIAGIKNTLKAGVEGAIGETATEGYQGYAEDVTAGKRAWNDTSDDALRNIYQNAAIGGMSGGVMSGGVHGVHTLLGISPEQVEAKVDSAKTKASFDEAVKNNTPEVFLDPKDRTTYNPGLAMGVLFQQNQAPDVEPLTRIENVERAQQIMDDLNKQHAELSDTAKNGSLKEAKEARTQLKSLNNHIDTAQGVMEQIESEHVKAMAPENITAMVEAANAPVDQANPDTVNHVISLAMSSTQYLSAKQAAELADNTSNGLSQEQRDYLRVFSQARIQENALSNMGKVSNDILVGENKIGGNLGIVKYRSRISAAMQTGNQERVQEQLGMLSDFADTHADKAKSFAEAVKLGTGSQIQKNQTSGKWEVVPATDTARILPAKELKANGGLEVDAVIQKSEKLSSNMTFEAKALNTARKEMTQAVALRFGKISGVAAQPAPVVQSTAPATQTQPTPATATPSPSATPLPSATQAGPKENILPKETGKDSAHLETNALENVEGKPQKEVDSEESAPDYKKELAGKDHREVTAKVQQVQKEQQKREKLLGDDAALTEYSAERGMSVDDMAELLANNHAANVPRLEAYEAALAAMPKPASQANKIKFKEVTPDDAKGAELMRQMEEELAQQAEAEQQASAPAESVVEEASPAVEETQAKEEKVDPLGLDAKRTPKGEERHYQKRNLIADYFNQRTGAKDGSSRPLASVKDFLSKLTSDAKHVFDYLPKIGGVQITPDMLQSDEYAPMYKALKSFFSTAREWTETITSNLSKEPNPDFHHTDMMQYLLDEQGDLPENVKTAIAYAAVAHIAQQATRSAINTADDINDLLGRNEGDPVGPQLANALARVGSWESVVVNSLGRTAVQALGLKARTNAPVNLQSDLEAALGAHVMKLLLDKGIMTRTIFTGQQMRELTGDVKTDTNKTFKFLALTRDENFALTKEAEAIFKSQIASKGILDKLFAAEPALRAPLTEPAKVTQTTTDTGMEVPKVEAKAIEKENAAEHRMNGDLWDVLSDVSEEQVLAMAGTESEDGLHVVRRMGVKAKNAGLVREWNRAKEFFTGLTDRTTPFFFEHTIWKMQRVGILTNLVNPQGSKMHRQMMYRPSWESTIQMNDLNGFFLRVAEGFGVKTDKKDMAAALADFKDKLALPEIGPAIDALTKKLDNQTLNEEEKAAIVAGVKAGGENFHSLSALMAMAKYEQARALGQTEFKTVLTGEVDGVTNGPMLSHLLAGAASTVGNLFDLLNKGGFYQVGKGSTNYNLWRAVAGHFDLYETTTRHMMDTVTQYATDGIYNKNGKLVMSPKRINQILPAVYFFTGTLAEDGKVTKDGRNIIKTPLTAMVFGSSVGRAVASMAENFVDAVYAKMEDVAKIKDSTEQEAARQQLIQHLRSLGLSVDPSVSIQDMLDKNLSKASIETLQKSFTQTIGAAVRLTIQADFHEFLEQRDAFNKTADLSYRIYNAAYTTVRDAYLQELIDNGGIAQRDALKKGQPTGKKIVMHDMTAEQKAELERRLAGLKPVMQTAFSQESNQPGAGLVVGKTGQQLSGRQMYSHTIKFGRPFADNGAESVLVHSNEETLVGPGAAMAPFSVHSSDAHVSMHAGEEVNSQNNHDARVAGINDVPAMAKALNGATWNTMLAYSPSSAIAETLVGVVRALPALYDRSGPKLSAAISAAIQEAMIVTSKTGEITEIMDIGNMVEKALGVAYQANDMKLQAMEQMAAIDQYALEGGQYEVTDADRAKAKVQRAKLTPELSKKDKVALDTVLEILAKAEKTAAEKPKAAPAEKENVPVIVPDPVAPEVRAQVKGLPPMGEALRPHLSDPRLVEALAKKPTMTIKEIVAVLRPIIKDEYYQKLLSQLERTIKGDVKVRYVTPDTDPKTLMPAPGGETFAGWYNYDSKTGAQEIYILSPDFKSSAVSEEILLHEMTHAALVGIVNMKNKSPEVQQLVNELNVLLKEARGYIASTPHLKGKNEAVQSVDELIAYGMTSMGFRNNVLDKIEMVSTTGTNRFVTAMQKFIDIVSELVFGRKNDRASTGLSVLMQNVSGLFEATAEQVGRESAPWDMPNQSLGMSTGLNDLTTSDIYEALAPLGNTQVAPEFDTHLRALMNNIVEKIHGPFGAFKAQLSSTITDPLSAWADAKQSGKAPFASSALASGFRFSEQEAFMAEQVEATVRAVLEAKDGSVTAAYREMVRLFDDAREKLTVADFPSQASYDFVFNVKLDQNNQSNYLSRFAALGLANEQFNQLLGFNTPIRTGGALTGKTLGEKLAALFDKLLAYINGKLTSTFEGQEANQKLGSLVQTLVDIESKQRMKLASSPMVMASFIDDTFRDISDKAREGAAKLGQSALFQNSKSGIVKLTGEIVAKGAQGRLGEWADAVQTFRDSQLKQKNGLLMGLVGEVRGATAVNAMFYKLMRLTKYLEGQRKELITNTQQFIMEGFKNGGDYITKEAKAAVSAFLRIDASVLLEHYKIGGIEKLVNDRALVKREIAVHERKLQRFGANANPYIGLSKALAYKLATGKITNRATLMNAENIAKMHGLPQAGRITAQDIKDATPIIDQLVSLYALDHFHEDHKHTAVGENKPLSKLAEVQNIFKVEGSRTDGHGLEFVLRQHRFLQDDSKARLFNTSGALAMKGYLPEVYNPYIKLVVGDARTEGVDLKAQGYSEGHAVEMDEANPAAHENQKIYTIRDGGMGRYLSGIISMTGMRSKGTRAHNGNTNLLSVTGQENLQLMSDIQRSQEYKDDVAVIMNGTFDPTKAKGARMAPVLNSDGHVVNYRYMMEEQTKDALLERDNRFDQLLGNMAGNTFDKEVSQDQNRTTIQALRDQYNAEFATHSKNYARVGPDSTDPEMREVWRMLPETTKQAIREIWGSNNMMVRYDLLDMTFGYRKLSMTDPFSVPPEERGRVEKLYVETLETILGRKAALRVHQFEDVWQALVREAKDTMVVKSGVTLLGNFTSNVSELIWFGVPVTDIIKHHRVALKGVMAHRKDSAELARLQMQVETGSIKGTALAEAQNRMRQLRDSMARNPVRELIEAGLMPTIVEDVANEADQYSFKSKFTAKSDAFLEKINPHVLKAGKLLVIAHDTPLYQGMAFATQVSDFLARYTLYQHTITRAKNKLDAETAVQLVSDAFVNYDIPSHRGVQFANDMGLVYFSKYYLRIQKVIALLYKQSPGRALMLLTAGHFLDFLPMLTHSAAIHRFGNPFSMGAFESITSLNELATVNALMTPFR